MREIKKRCLNCDKEFYVSESDALFSSDYCSNECQETAEYEGEEEGVEEYGE